MRAWIQQWLKPPQFDDPEKTRIASVLHPILLTVGGTIVCLMGTALHPRVAPNPAPVLAIDAFILGLVATSMWVLRRGHVQAASIAFSSVLWFTVSFSLIVFGGLSSPTAALYVAVAVLAGFFWGGRGVIGFSVMTAVTSFTIAAIQAQGLLPVPLGPITPANSWITLTLALLLSSLVLSLSTRATDRAVAEAQRNERAHRESEDRYRGLLEQSPDALFLLAEGRILFANQTLAVMLGALGSSELVGRDAVSLLQPNGDDDQQAHTREALGNPDEGHLIQDHWERADGERFPVELSARSLQLEGRPAIQVLARDVSERVALEDELRQAQKMEAIGRLAGGIAHDFNNMLTAISGHTRYIKRSLDPSSEAYEDANEIQRATKRAAELTQKLLAFSRRQVLTPVVMDLNEAIREEEGMLRRLIGANIQLVTDLSSQLGCVKADPVQIEQVLLNLCVNARDSIGLAGEIHIQTRNVAIRTSEATSPGDYVELCVRDDGAGMDESTRAQVFDPFFTTKDRFKGTGLGLSTVYGIVKQSGGTIEVDSAPDEGSEFRIRLPRLEAGCEVSQQVAPRKVEPGNETILLAEDEAPVRRLVERFLTQAGYTILAAGDGAKALELATRHTGRIDLLLSDVIMPEMGGPELAEKLKESHPECHVLFMSGYAGDQLERHGMSRDELSWISKPFAADQLTAKVREVLDRES